VWREGCYIETGGPRDLAACVFVEEKCGYLMLGVGG
jgi:hypothetical protein